MDHLTSVKTALLVERQALSACRVKCYAASQFTPTPQNKKKSPSLFLSGGLSLSPTNLLLNSHLLPLIYLCFSFSYLSHVLTLYPSLSLSFSLLGYIHAANLRLKFLLIQSNHHHFGSFAKGLGLLRISI